MKLITDKFLSEFTKNQATNEEIHENILEGMNVHGANFIILMCAILIASVGLNMNSSAVIIGAMLISPLMGCITGIGYGVGTYNVKLLKEAFKILTISVFISLATSTLYFSITPITTAGSEILSRTSPTIWDVIIAFAGGIVGMIGITRNKSSNVIPGVAIATALMPPLCTAGYGLSIRSYHIVFGASYLFFINCFFIVTATFIITKVLRLPVRKYLDKETQKSVKRVIIVLAIVVMIPSLFSAISMIEETIYESNLNAFIDKELKDQYVIEKRINKQSNTITLVVMGDKISDYEIDELEGRLSSYGFEGMDLVITQDESNIGNIEKYLNEIRNNTIIHEKEQLIEESEVEKIDIEEISSELKIIYPSIEKVYTGYIASDNSGDNEVSILIIYSSDESLNENIATIKSWFETKTNSKESQVFIQKPVNIEEEVIDE